MHEYFIEYNSVHLYTVHDKWLEMVGNVLCNDYKVDWTNVFSFPTDWIENSFKFNKIICQKNHIEYETNLCAGSMHFWCVCFFFADWNSKRMNFCMQCYGATAGAIQSWNAC